MNGYNPYVSLAFFAAVVGFTVFIMNPIFLLISLICAVLYACLLTPLGKIAKYLSLVLPLVAITAVMNPLFNHRGVTILAYLPNGNPVTLEAVLYGIAAAIMLAAVVTWFLCFNKVMTSDKFIYVLGFSPALALVLSITLRMLPRFRARLKEITAAQAAASPLVTSAEYRDNSRNVTKRSFLARKKNSVKKAIKILSILISWTLEDCIETADSMKSRGYGLRPRTSFSIFTFTRRDVFALGYIALCAVIILVGDFGDFPSFNLGGGRAFLAFAALCLLPILSIIREQLTWKFSQSKI
ncbi:MAG: energy-coupling factor transporter transmembrane protein EcfT [Defluviitaleaceae bacterium]|nr:energy-coupling factor transporter transmembrane protein EcfT [Defluviitaleaceae bacterium]